MDGYGDEKKISYLQEWFEDNKNLPKKIDRILLMRFYQSSNKDVEETKKLLELHYTLRQSRPNTFIHRDPTDEATNNSAAYSDYVALPTLTPENYRILIKHINNPDPKLMDCVSDIKACVMVDDCRFSIPDMVSEDNTPQIAMGDIQIIDMDNVSVKHLPRLSVSDIRPYMKFLQQAYPVEIKGMHIINCPWFMNTIVAILKPFLKKEVFEMIRFHTRDLKTLYEHVPKELLPLEYGGNAGTLSDIKENFLKSIYAKRDYIMDADYWKIENS